MPAQHPALLRLLSPEYFAFVLKNKDFPISKIPVITAAAAIHLSLAPLRKDKNFFIFFVIIFFVDAFFVVFLMTENGLHHRLPGGAVIFGGRLILKVRAHNQP